jgi:hypothetical protein
MKGLIEWTEGEVSRGRKVVLFSTILVFLLITIGLFGGAIYGLSMSDMVPGLYVTLVTLMIAIYGFYTGTASDKSAKLADKAADIMLKKLEETSGKKSKSEPSNSGYDFEDYE